MRQGSFHTPWSDLGQSVFWPKHDALITMGTFYSLLAHYIFFRNGLFEQKPIIVSSKNAYCLWQILFNALHDLQKRWKFSNIQQQESYVIAIWASIHFI